MKLKSVAKRLGVFIFFDRDSIVDDYVIYILNSFREAVDDLIIVSNSQLDYPELAKLLKYTDDVIVRNNIGLDAGAFKEVYDLKGDTFKNYDELILMNDTFYGPFKSFKNIVDEIASKDLDFWGLSANYDSVDGYNCLPDGMIHSHVQTFFVAYRNNVLISDAFNDYWKKYDISKMRSFFDVVTKHEIAFTYYLEQNGFKWGIYSDLSKFRSKDIKGNFNCYAYVSYDMTKNCNFPVIKRKNFVFDKKEALYLTDGADARRSFDYLKDNQLYDTDMILKNLIRLYKPEDLYYGLNLNYVIEEATENTNSLLDKCSILFVLNDNKYVKKYIDIIKYLKIKNVFVMSNDKCIQKEIVDNNLVLIDSNDFVSTKYEYICLINDSYLGSQEIISAYDYNLLNIFNNGLFSNKYVESILKIFMENKYIGGLVLPGSNHSTYYGDSVNKNNIFGANKNCLWIRSQLFSSDLLLETDFVNKYLNLINNNKLLIGKIYNFKDVGNVLCVQQKIISELNGNLREYHGLINNTFIDSINHIKSMGSYHCSPYFMKKVSKKIISFLKRLK